MTTSLRMFGPDGALLNTLPDHEGLGAQQEHNDTGSFSCKYSRAGLNASLIDRDVAYVGLMVDGVEQKDRYLLEDDGEDPTSTGGAARLIDVGGRGVMALLEWAVVYPADHVPGMTGTALFNLAPAHSFANSTPGAIISTFIERAKARSVFDGANGAADAIRTLTYDFTSAVDSAGQPWPTVYSVTYEAGLDALKVLLAACDNAWCDARMDGMTLRLFVPDTVYGQDRPDVIVRAGREVTSGPRKRTRRPIRSHMLGIGDEGAIVERKNLAARARYGRREGYEARGGITAVDTLTRVTDVSLLAVSAASEGFTLVCDLSAKGPQPGVDYEVGQRIRYDQRRLNDTDFEPMRVKTVALAWDKQGNRTASVEVNDLFVESQVRLKRKVDGILNGSSSNSRAPQGDIFNDRLAPKAPASVSIDTGTFLRDDGSIGAAATVSWPAVTQNVDGTVYDDAGNYFLSWAYVTAAGVSEEFVAEQLSRTTVSYIEDLRPGRRMVARVRTVDSSGNSSDWTTSPIVTIVQDTVAPPVPTVPVVTAGLAILRVTWDGLGEAGGGATQPMPTDLSHVEVHVSTVGANFLPSNATLNDSVLGAGVVAVVSDLPYGTVVWVRLVAVDYTGNRSGPSVAASGTITRVSGLDIKTDSLGRELVTFNARDIGGVTTYHQAEPPAGTAAVPLVSGDVWFETDRGNALHRWNGAAWAASPLGGESIAVQSITAQNMAISSITAQNAALADLAVVRAKIADLAVDDAKIANLSVGKLTVGVLSADITLSARIKTADVGARVEINSAGVQAFDAAGAKTFNVDSATGSVMMVGVLATAFSGARVEIGTTAGRNTIDFFTNTESPAVPTRIFHDGQFLSMHSSQQTGAICGKIQVGASSIFITAGVLPNSPSTTQSVIEMYAGKRDTTFGSKYVRGAATIPVDETIHDSVGSKDSFFLGLVSSTGAVTQGSVGSKMRAVWATAAADGSGERSTYAVELIMGTIGLSTYNNGLHVGTARTDPWQPWSYKAVNASGYNIASRRAVKQDVKALAMDSLAAVQRAPISRWRYKADVALDGTQMPPPDPDGDPDVEARIVRGVFRAVEHIGPMADDLPVECLSETGDAVDLHAMVSLLWAAVQDLSNQVVFKPR